MRVRGNNIKCKKTTLYHHLEVMRIDGLYMDDESNNEVTVSDRWVDSWFRKCRCRNQATTLDARRNKPTFQVNTYDE